MTCQLSMILALDLREQHGAHERAAVRVQPRRAVRLEDRHMRAEPGRVPAAGGEPPAPGDPDAALDRDAAPGAGQFRPPGEDAARRPEDLARHRRVEIGRGHRAARILPERPGGAGLGLGDFFEHLDIGQRVQLGAAQRARQQQLEKAALDQRLDHPLGQLALLLDLVGGILEQRRQIARALDIVDAAGLGAGRSTVIDAILFLRLPAALARPARCACTGYIGARRRATISAPARRVPGGGSRPRRSAGERERAPPAPGQQPGQEAPRTRSPRSPTARRSARRARRSG